MVATYPVDWGNGSMTSFTASLNYNEKELTSNADAFLNAPWRGGYYYLRLDVDF